MSEKTAKESMKEEGKPFFKITLKEAPQGSAQAEFSVQGKREDIILLGVSGMASIALYLLEYGSISYSSLMEGFFLSMREVEKVKAGYGRA